MRTMVAVATLLAAAMTMQLRSGDFSAGGVIPLQAMAVDCGGGNRSPELHWSEAPSGAKSFALIVHDPDAPMPGGFYHWVVYNVSAGARGIAPGAKLSADQLGETSAGKAGYYGPCPPPGPAHHYAFALYALDIGHIAANGPLTGPELQRRMTGHVLARAVLVGLAARH